ncbi:MAG: response regulator [Cyanobacteria bacterium P01_E01_bin.48]
MARILIAEDEERLAALLVRGLKRDGHETEVTASGDITLQLLLDDSFDLCLLDLMLPEIDGQTVLARARASGLVLPIVILSALADRDTQESCLSLGATDFIAKPFSLSGLRDRIRALLAPND